MNQLSSQLLHLLTLSSLTLNPLSSNHHPSKSLFLYSHWIWTICHFTNLSEARTLNFKHNLKQIQEDPQKKPQKNWNLQVLQLTSRRWLTKWNGCKHTELLIKNIRLHCCHEEGKLQKVFQENSRHHCRGLSCLVCVSDTWGAAMWLLEMKLLSKMLLFDFLSLQAHFCFHMVTVKISTALKKRQVPFNQHCKWFQYCISLMSFHAWF